GSSKSIGEAMQAMLSSPRRPSALLVARSAYALTAVSHLLSERHRIPEDMALICRDDDAFLDHLVPRITRYTVNPGHFAKQVYRLIKNPRATTCVQVMPALLERESL
ncbi:MAG: LacI family DNA-binding transcriptional regulator, partial [Verrucomicrobiales bacterium]|nr:LacI family DNA-binding transcriptional regulator [Verrucomicrobiales bacterium]